MSSAGVVKSTKKGFTLIELLVVISIIALLLSILMPSLQKVKDQARTMVCQSNLKQLSLGFMMYLQGNKNKGPESPGGYYADNYIPWSEQILSYMGDAQYALNPEKYTQKVMFCPSTLPPISQGYCGGLPKNRWRYDIQSAAMKGRQVEGSYAMNAWVGGGKSDTYGFTAEELSAKSFRTNISGSADVPVFGDATFFYSYPRDTDKAPRRNISSSSVIGDFFNTSSGSLNTMLMYYINRHSMKVNSSFADGHVGSVPLTELWNQKWHKGFKKIANVPIPDKK